MTDLQETRIETYIPLYRKYRPQSFADVVGQEAIVQTLGNAIQLNKVAHAYLLCGPRGTGKTSTARIFAKSLNCEQGPTVSPCLQCASCVGITQGNALDVIEFDAASNNGVGDARELIENCQYSSMTGRFKVYIIDEVHMLTPQAFNALLKTLEEPPPNVIFIFATTEGHKVLPTIISRCQRFDFNRITTDSIVNRLRHIATQESITIDDEALLMIARHARGGLRDAVGLLDQVAVLGRANPGKSIARKDVALFIGTLEEELLLRLSRSVAERRAADLLNDLTELMHRGIEPIQLLKDLTVHFRNLLLVQAAGPQANPDALSLPPDYFTALAEQSALFPEPEELPQIIGRLAFVERNIRNGTQPQLWLEVGLLELAYRHEIYQVKELTERVCRLEAQLSGHAGMPVMPQQPAQAASRSVSVAPPAPMSTPAAPPRMSPPPAPAPVASPAPSLQQAPSPALVTPAPASAQPMMPPSHTMSAQPTMAQSSAPAPLPNASAQASLALPSTGGSAGQTDGSTSDGSPEAAYRQICATVPSLTLRSLLQQQSFALSFEGDVLTVGVASEPNLAVVKKPDRLIHLQKAADKFYGRPIRLELVYEKNRPVSALMPEPPAKPSPPARPAANPAMASTVVNAVAQFAEARPTSHAVAPSDQASAAMSASPSSDIGNISITGLSSEPTLRSDSGMPPASGGFDAGAHSASGLNVGSSGQPFGSASVALAEPRARVAAMPSLPESKPIEGLGMGIPAKKASTSSPPMDEDAPPLDFGAPPLDLDDDDDDRYAPTRPSAAEAPNTADALLTPKQSSSEDCPSDSLGTASAEAPSSATAFEISLAAGGDADLAEAKKHAVELLQGRLLD